MLPKQKGLSQGHRVQKEQIQDLITSPCVKIQIVWHISLSSLELDLFQLNLMPSAHHTLGFTSVQVPREQPAHSDLQAFAQAVSCNCHPLSSLHFFAWLFACHPFILCINPTASESHFQFPSLYWRPSSFLLCGYPITTLYTHCTVIACPHI